mmetsp:Transcript_37587/g.84005  ORF Transcript_37587/g.84005 Transcript_37587/m.84005 type:complete len:81 (-) Transcript_37587:1459-1701(-)
MPKQDDTSSAKFGFSTLSNMVNLSQPHFNPGELLGTDHADFVKKVKLCILVITLEIIQRIVLLGLYFLEVFNIKALFAVH